MIYGYKLPTTLTIANVEYELRTDFRAVLDILRYYNDPDYSDEAKALIMIRIMFPRWKDIPPENYQEAIDKAAEFIDMGIEHSDKAQPTLMDWEQDAPIIIAAVNNVAGKEIRAEQYVHWWTFLGWYLSIRESLFSDVLAIRSKKVRGEALEKHEQRFYRENRNIIDLREKHSEADMELLGAWGVKI